MAGKPEVKVLIVSAWTSQQCTYMVEWVGREKEVNTGSSKIKVWEREKKPHIILFILLIVYKTPPDVGKHWERIKILEIITEAAAHFTD